MAVAIKGTRLVYFPVPKVACSSIKTAIFEHNVPGRSDMLNYSAETGQGKHIHHIYPTKRLMLRGLPDRLRYSVGWKWFAVVRDPLARFVSGYRNRILHHRDLETAPIPEGLPQEPDINCFAMELARYCRANVSLNHHFVPMVTYLGKRPERFERIFDISQMAQLRDYIAEHGADLSFDRKQVGGPSISVDELDDRSRAALREVYAEDYAIWGRFFGGQAD